jgi:uncharacterized Ntn-hydrolase superfamily protein
MIQRKTMRYLLIITLLAIPLATQPSTVPKRPVNTYSIVAYDPNTRQLGVAVQSHWFCVGCTVSWAQAGVGAVATQSFIDPSYGALGLDMMRAGRSAPDTLKGLLIADKHRDVRQVAMVDAEGRAAAWTGASDIQAAGHVVGGMAKSATNASSDHGAFSSGKNYSVQANLMVNNKVWPAMARAFESTKGDLAERMLTALEAAQAVGGDSRGRQSAALIVVRGKSTGEPWTDRVFDLRVDDDPQPLEELRRLVTLARAYHHMNAGDLAIERKDNNAALREYGAAEKLVAGKQSITPDRRAEILYWHAVALVNMGRVDKSLPLFKRAFALHAAWRQLTPRLSEAGLLPDNSKIIHRIEAVK